MLRNRLGMSVRGKKCLDGYCEWAGVGGKLISPTRMKERLSWGQKESTVRILHLLLPK